MKASHGPTNGSKAKWLALWAGLTSFAAIGLIIYSIFWVNGIVSSSEQGALALYLSSGLMLAASVTAMIAGAYAMVRDRLSAPAMLGFALGGLAFLYSAMLLARLPAS